MTLVEVMVSMAVASVVIAAAAASILSMAKVNRDGSRRSGIDLQLRMAMVYLERAIANAGLNFPAPEFAFRVRNNVPVGSLSNGHSIGSGDPGESSLDVVDESSTAVGVVAGTDVIEIAWSDPLQHRAGRVVSCPGGTCWTLNSASAAATLVTTNPFRVWTGGNEWANVIGAGVPKGPLLLFRDIGTGNSCLARALDYSGATGTVTLRLVDFDLNEETRYQSCPAAGMLVYALDGRQRFMIYRATAGGLPGLYVQNVVRDSNPPAPDPQLDPIPSFGAPVLLAEGVEDMQVSPQVSGTAICGDLTKPLCYCNRDAGDDPALLANPVCTIGNPDVTFIGGLGSSPTAAARAVRGAMIHLTARSTTTMEVRGFDYRRFAAFDHPAATGAADNEFREAFQVPVMMLNTALGELSN